MHSKTGSETSKEENENNQTLSKGQCASHTAGFTLPEPIAGRMEKPQIHCLLAAHMARL